MKPMSPIQFRMFLSYLIPFIVYFIILGLVLNGQLRPTRKGMGMSLGSEMAINVAFWSWASLVCWRFNISRF